MVHWLTRLGVRCVDVVTRNIKRFRTNAPSAGTPFAAGGAVCTDRHLTNSSTIEAKIIGEQLVVNVCLDV